MRLIINIASPVKLSGCVSQCWPPNHSYHKIFITINLSISSWRHWTVTGTYCKNEYKLIRKQRMMVLWKLMVCLPEKKGCIKPTLNIFWILLCPHLTYQPCLLQIMLISMSNSFSIAFLVKKKRSSQIIFTCNISTTVPALNHGIKNINYMAKCMRTCNFTHLVEEEG